MKKILFVLLFFHFVLASFAQNVKSFSLVEAQEYALQNNEKYKNSLLDENIAKLKVVETRGMGLPQINLSGSFNNFINLPVQVVDASFINPYAKKGETISFRAGTTYNASGTLQASQLLFNGSYIVGLQVSKFYRDFTATGSEKTKEDVLLDVAQSYHLFAVAKENVQFMDSLVILSKQLIEKQKNYFELGLMVKEDMDQLEFSLSNAEYTLQNAKLQLDNAAALLKFSMGISQKDNIDISENVGILYQKNIGINTSSYSLTNNINYQLLSKQVQLNSFNLKNKKAQNLPTLSAFFQQTYNAYRNDFDLFADKKWFPQTLWGLQLNVPIFSGLSRHAQISQARVEVEKSKNALNEFQRALELQQIQYLNNYQNALNQLTLQKQNVDLAKNIYLNAVLKEKIGNGNSILVSQKYNQLIISQAQYIGSMLDLFTSKINIDRLYHQNK
ncbi:MAG: TolC family protein [Flavobacteriia bacterium]|nr:TolC family protein [Flavobacteriia bacterium]